MLFHRRRLAALFGGASLSPLAAQAQGAWPSRPVTIVVPFVPGGPSDVLARALSAPLQGGIGQPVLVENRTGANGLVAVQHVLRQPADGHTLFIGASGLMSVTPAINPRLPYDPVQDFTHLTLAISAPNVMVVHPSLPATNVAELVAWLRANPTAGSFGSSGIGSSEQFGMELFKLRTSTQATHIPYTGTAAAVTDLLAGTVNLSTLNIATVAPHVQAGRLRAIAVGSAARHPLLPTVPSFIEQGLPDFLTGSWHGIVAPRGLDPALQARLQEVLREALRSPDVAQRLAATGFAVEATDGAALRRLVETDLARWREVVRAAGISAG
jgi:tripartite-type tricarboxylate transporter receptor subunit TctC